jgi:hypothetical protein
MVSEMHEVDEAKRLLAEGQSEELARELVWSAADHGCPEIVALALPHLHWPRMDSRWHWILIQPIRGAGGDTSQNEGHFQSMGALLRPVLTLTCRASARPRFTLPLRVKAASPERTERGLLRC